MTSLQTLIICMMIDFHKHCQLEYGEYMQMHKEHDNLLSMHTIGTHILLVPLLYDLLAINKGGIT